MKHRSFLFSVSIVATLLSVSGCGEKRPAVEDLSGSNGNASSVVDLATESTPSSNAAVSPISVSPITTTPQDAYTTKVLHDYLLWFQQFNTESLRDTNRQTEEMDAHSDKISSTTNGPLTPAQYQIIQDDSLAAARLTRTIAETFRARTAPPDCKALANIYQRLYDDTAQSMELAATIVRDCPGIDSPACKQKTAQLEQSEKTMSEYSVAAQVTIDTEWARLRAEHPEFNLNPNLDH